MAGASRSVRSQGFSFRGFIFLILGLGLLVALFFIPEIIQLQSGKSTSGSNMKTLQTAAVSAPKNPKESQLNRISALIDSGYLEKLGETGTAKGTSDDPQDKQASQDSGKSDLKSHEGVSWKGIKSKDSKAEVKKSHTEITNIANTLPADKKGSRLALLNFANGLQQVVEGNTEKNMPAQEALVKLENLHSTATRELLREGVSPVAYRRFNSLFYGSELSRYSIKLSGDLIPFNPQLTLTNLDLSRRGKGGPLNISFDGYVVGEDVDRIELVCGGVRFDDIQPRGVNASGLRKFKSKRFALTGKVLLKVFDHRGRVYQKLYSFYPRARIFENQKGRFQIPASASDYDTRLDKFFTYQISQTNESSENFFESQGFEKF